MKRTSWIDLLHGQPNISPLDFHVSHSYYGVTNGVTSLRGQKINYSNFSLLKSHISNGAESPLRHHKKINGLEEKVFLLARFSFSQIAILPHYAPTPGNLLKFLGVPTYRCPHLPWGRRAAFTILPSFLKLLRVIRMECPGGAFLFSQSPFTAHVPSQKIRPPPVFTEEGRNLALLCLWLHATAAGELASCRCAGSPWVVPTA